jgi:NAD(P)-dependent dehydrogenase (short-subunit alcohol dehydrogenase family)
MNPLYRKRVAVTGGACGIGREIVRAFGEHEAIVAALDVNRDGLAAVAAETGCLSVPCDVTDDASVATAFGRLEAELGGIDILVSNAGSGGQSPIGDTSVAALMRSFDINFFGHQRVAQAALGMFRRHTVPGLLLFNISNQSVNAGRDFGPYGIPKAAVMALMKQYALDHGHEGIRANGVNAGRIRSGLLNDDTIRQRAGLRGLTVDAYMAGNLLGVEVTAADVAQCFVHLALLDKVNAAVLTVDGGTIATSLR